MSKYFKCFTNKNAIWYSVGEEIIFNVYAIEDGNNVECKRAKWSLEGDDGQRYSGEASIGIDKPLEVKYILNKAGFVHLICTAIDDNGEAIEGFDQLNSSVGANVLDLEYSDSIPEDFDEYWDEIEELVANTEINIVHYEEKPADFHPGYKVYQVMIETPIGRPASGCITIPDGGEKYPLKMSFLGYGIHAAYYEYDKTKITATFNAHGFENSKNDEELAKAYGKELSMYGFNNEENASNKTTYFRNMMIRNLIALKYAKTIPEWNGKDIISTGGSQGALQSVTLAAHDKDVTEVVAYKPWFCDLKSNTVGYLNGWRPEFAEGLRYFDTVAQVSRIKCPIRIQCYLGDYVCPPKTVMALFNTAKVKKRIEFFQSATHSYFPPDCNKDIPEYIWEENV